MKLTCWAIGRELQRREFDYDFGASTLALQDRAVEISDHHAQVRVGVMRLFDRITAQRRGALRAVEPENDVIVSLDQNERQLLEAARAREKRFQHLRRTLSRSIASARSAALSTEFASSIDFARLQAERRRTSEPLMVGGTQDSFLARMSDIEVRQHQAAPGLRTLTKCAASQLPIHWRAETDVYRLSRGAGPSLAEPRMSPTSPRSTLEQAWKWIWESAPEHHRYATLGSFLNWVTGSFGQPDVESREQAMAAGTAYLLSRSRLSRSGQSALRG